MLMGTPLIFGPAAGRPHLATIMVLHCFTWSGREMAVYRLPRLRAAMPASVFNCMRVVFLAAPHRPITCFGGRETPAWHDYYTDHGGKEGRPNLEEEINLEHLAWSRAQVHAALDDELARLGPAGPGKLALVGESQGACVALDAALSYPSNTLLAGVFSSYGQLYSHTKVPAGPLRMPISAFIGAGDCCIGAGLSLHSFGRLLEAGFSNVEVEVAPRIPHVYEPQPDEADLEYAAIARALQRWGLFSVPSPKPDVAAHPATGTGLDATGVTDSVGGAALSPSGAASAYPSAWAGDGMSPSSQEGSGAASHTAPDGWEQTSVPTLPPWVNTPDKERRPPPEPTEELMALVDEAERRGAEEGRARERRERGASQPEDPP